MKDDADMPHLELFITDGDLNTHKVWLLANIEGELGKNCKFTATFGLDRECKGQAILRDSAHVHSGGRLPIAGEIHYDDGFEGHTPSRRKFIVRDVEYKELLANGPMRMCVATITMDNVVFFFSPMPLKSSKKAKRSKPAKRTKKRGK